MKRLFKQFSFPGGLPNHVAPEPTGVAPSMKALSRAYGAVPA